MNAVNQALQATQYVNQYKDEVGDEEISRLQQGMLKQKYGMIRPTLDENPIAYENLPDFLAAQQFLTAMYNRFFKPSKVRHAWKQLKNSQKKSRRLNRNNSRNLNTSN